jgi:uncharacterized membrane protein YdjX (TVP38/TMEM64 family)
MDQEDKRPKKKKWKGLILPLILIAALFILGRMIDLDHYLGSIRGWILGIGPWGMLAYVGLYVAATLVFLPGTPFTILAAFLFGGPWGFLTMVVATTIEAIVAFLIARYLARRKVEEMLAGTPLFEKMKGMLEQNHRIAIPFLRLLPFFPFSVNNYALGLTHISFWSYIFYSEIIFVPMNALMVFGANAIYSVIVRGETSWPLMLGSTVAALLLLAVGYVGKRHLGGSAESHGTDSGR